MILSIANRTLGVEEMDNPLVSVVSPCYNGEKYIGRFLESVLNQTYLNLELIIINDGSTDNTEKIIKRYQKIFEERGNKFTYLYQKNAGQAAALNNGLKYFSGEYLVCMDSDDEIMPEFIEENVKFLEKHTAYVFCRGQGVEINEDKPDKIVHIYGERHTTNRYSFFEDLIYIRDVFYSGYMIKKDAFDTAISNREIYCGKGGQNAEILLPLGWYYGEPGYVEKAIYKYYVHNDSHSHSINTIEKVIEQLWNYEKILIATIEKIDDHEVIKYFNVIKKRFSKLRFGNAVDSKNSELIKKYYYLLKENKANTFQDFLLYCKYTNKFIRKCFGVKDENENHF